MSISKPKIATPVLLTVFVAASLISSLSHSDTMNEKIHKCYKIDLKSGTVPPSKPSFIKLLVPPEDSNGDSWNESLVKLTLNDPHMKKSPKAVSITLHYSGIPTGISLNIGDSQSNNGFGGDGASQSNDAELQIGSLLGLENEDEYNDMYVFGRDGYLAARGSESFMHVYNVAKKKEKISFVIANGRFKYQNDKIPQQGEIKSSWLYALAGQPDTEGPINHDIYASFNRVIAGGRYGTGVRKVEICPVYHW